MASDLRRQLAPGPTPPQGKALTKVAGSSPSAVYYVFTDHLGTPRAITRPVDNRIVWRWDNTEPFGNSAPNENPSGVGAFRYNLRFPGQYFDQETGTHYNYFRDYDPAIGRYVQSDPIGFEGGINTFAYVNGNPIVGIDPLGLVDVCYGMPIQFPHYWICANGVCGGLVPESIWGTFGSQGHVRAQTPGLADNGGDASFCQRANANKCDESKLNQCVANAIRSQLGNLYYNVALHNCQDWAWETLQTCRAQACSR